jgi:hypothetical protein
MALNLSAPKFDRAQRVGFLGGEGIVFGAHAEAGCWTYVIKLPLGPAPACGRVGGETLVLLHEAELRTTTP